MTVSGGFRHVVSPIAPSPARPLIEPYVTFSVIRLSGSLPPRHSALVHNAPLQNIEARLSPEGAGRSPERPMPALIFVPQPASELVVDVFVDHPEVSSSVEPGEVRPPPPQEWVEARDFFAQWDASLPPDEFGFYPEHAASSGAKASSSRTAGRVVSAACGSVRQGKSNPALADTIRVLSSLTMTRSRASIARSFGI
jgi:hypothetical protein